MTISMLHLIWCLVYLAAIGLISFIVGRIIPKDKLRWDSFFFRTHPWEHGGKVYDRLHIRKWKDAVPDMSRILPKVMPARMTSDINFSAAEAEHMLEETCMAEAVHGALSILGLACIWIWRSWQGILVAALYFIINVLYMIIQRYNRPRMLRLLRYRMTDEEMKK